MFRTKNTQGARNKKTFQALKTDLQFFYKNPLKMYISRAVGRTKIVDPSFSAEYAHFYWFSRYWLAPTEISAAKTAIFS